MSETTWMSHPVYTAYEVSNDGRIRSIDRIVEVPASRRCKPFKRFHPGREIKTHLNAHNGYLMTALRVKGEHVNVTLHRMVCEAFHGLPASPKLEVRHLNGIKTDCRPENLTWGTRQENSMDRQVHGHDPQLNKTHCPRGHEYTPENTYSQPGKRRSRICRTCTRERREKRKVCK